MKLVRRPASGTQKWCAAACDGESLFQCVATDTATRSTANHGDLMRCLRALCLQLRCALVQDAAEPTRSRPRLLGFSKVCVGRMCSHAASCSQSYSRSSHPAPPHLQRTINHHSQPQADTRVQDREIMSNLEVEPSCGVLGPALTYPLYMHFTSVCPRCHYHGSPSSVHKSVSAAVYPQGGVVPCTNSSAK